MPIEPAQHDAPRSGRRESSSCAVVGQLLYLHHKDEYEVPMRLYSIEYVVVVGIFALCIGCGVNSGSDTQRQIAGMDLLDAAEQLAPVLLEADAAGQLPMTWKELMSSRYSERDVVRRVREKTYKYLRTDSIRIEVKSDKDVTTYVIIGEMEYAGHKESCEVEATYDSDGAFKSRILKWKD